MKFEKISDSVSLFSIPHLCYGLEFGARMTVVRLKSGKLWVHSPLPLTEDVTSQIDSLGEVAYLVAPNSFHHLYVHEWKRRYPSARTFGSSSLQKKKKNFQFDAEIPREFEGEIQSLTVEGSPMLEETVFFIPAEKTLIITDLVLNLSPPVGLFTRLYLKFSGIFGKAGVSPFIKMVVKDKAKSGESLKGILSLDFDRLLLAHGDPVLSNGKSVLEESYRWLLSR